MFYHQTTETVSTPTTSRGSARVYTPQARTIKRTHYFYATCIVLSLTVSNPQLQNNVIRSKRVNIIKKMLT